MAERAAATTNERSSADREIPSAEHEVEGPGSSEGQPGQSQSSEQGRPDRSSYAPASADDGLLATNGTLRVDLFQSVAPRPPLTGRAVQANAYVSSYNGRMYTIPIDSDLGREYAQLTTRAEKRAFLIEHGGGNTRQSTTQTVTPAANEDPAV